MARKHELLTLEEVVSELKRTADPARKEGMAKVGIAPDRAFGTPVPDIRALGRRIGKDHELAHRLWKTGIREPMILAGIIDDPHLVTEGQMDEWVADLYDWEVCDQCIMNLFEDVPFSLDKALEWAKADREYVKRAGFVLMARLSQARKDLPDEHFLTYFPLIKEGAKDERRTVMMAVSWALRQIGKRSLYLNGEAVKAGQSMAHMEGKGPKWVSSDALKELKSDAVVGRLKLKEAPR